MKRNRIQAAPVEGRGPGTEPSTITAPVTVRVDCLRCGPQAARLNRQQIRCGRCGAFIGRRVEGGRA